MSTEITSSEQDQIIKWRKHVAAMHCRFEEAKICAIPADDRASIGLGNDEVETRAEEAKQHRNLAARANYLGLVRQDVQFPSRALCQRMSKPMKGDFEHVSRLGRYLRSHPRAIWSFPWGHDVSEVIVRTDSDWAGDKRDRASVSGVMLMIGSHLIKPCSKDQIWSSGEAELCTGRDCQKAWVSCRSRTIGVCRWVCLWSWTQARRRAFLERSGLGKVRHVDVEALWAQSVLKSGRAKAKLRKIFALGNTAHLGTKPFPWQRIRGLWREWRSSHRSA